jgi:hypothetical protein
VSVSEMFRQYRRLCTRRCAAHTARRASERGWCVRFASRYGTPMTAPSPCRIRTPHHYAPFDWTLNEQPR